MDLLTAKLISMVGTACLALFFGLLPLKVKKLILQGEENSKKRLRRENIISCLLCFGAGVLIATVFVHMLPETRENFAKARKLGLLGGKKVPVKNESLHHNHKTHPLHRIDRKYDDHTGHDHGNHIGHEDRTGHDHGNHASHDYEDHAGHDHEDQAGLDHKEPINGHDHGDHTGHDHGDHTGHNQEDEAGHDHNNNDGNVDHTKLEQENSTGHTDHIGHNHENHADPTSHNDHAGHDHIDDAEPTGHNDHNSHGGHTDHDHNVDHEEPTYNVANFNKNPKLEQVHLVLQTTQFAKAEEDFSTILPENLDHVPTNLEAMERKSTIDPIFYNENDTVDDIQNSKVIAIDEKILMELLRTTEIPEISTNNFKKNKIYENTIDTLTIADSVDLSKTKIVKPTKAAVTDDHDHSHDHDDHSSRHHPHSEALTHGDHSDHEHDHDDHSYPLAELTICLGFFLIYLIEEIVHKVFFRNAEKAYEQGSSNGHGHSHTHVPKKIEKKVSDPQPIIRADAYPLQVNHTYSKSMSPRSDWSSGGIDNPVFSGDVDATGWNPRIKNTMRSNSKVLPITDEVIANGYSNSVLNGTVDNSPKICKAKPSGITLLATVQNLLIVLAIGFHAIFEGMAIGLQESMTDVWYLTFAISAHKFVIMFCVGLELLKDDTSKSQMVLSTVVLALITPLGTAIGIIVTENSGFGGSEHYLIISILQGLAGGTLVYVAFLEILERERSKVGARFIKFLSIFTGFSFMCSLEALGGHSH